jgi:hypothetical protein
MPRQDARAGMRAFLAHRAATLARLRRVNEALSRWDEYEAAAELPEDCRPLVEPPTLGRAALKELQRMLCAFVGELEEAWERRN